MGTDKEKYALDSEKAQANGLSFKLYADLYCIEKSEHRIKIVLEWGRQSDNCYILADLYIHIAAVHGAVREYSVVICAGKLNRDVFAGLNVH